MPPAPPPGLVPQSSAKPQVSFTKRLRQNHVNLLGAFNSVEKFNDLLHSAFAQGIIDDDNYEMFLTKLEHNPQRPVSTLSSRLLLIIYKHLEKNVEDFPAFYECTIVKSVNHMDEGNSTILVIA